MSLPMPPPTHPATATGHIPHDSIGPLPPHLSDIGSPERQNSIAYTSPIANNASPTHYSQPMQHSSPTHYAQPVQHSSPTQYAQPVQHSSPAYASSVPPAQGKTYEQEVSEFLDQTSPARIREQSPTNLPSDTYMAKANEESMTNANSPARAREGSPYASGVQTSTYQPAYAGVQHSSPTQYSQPVQHASPTLYSQPIQHSSPTQYAQPVQHSSPAYASSVPPAQGKTYEQEVNEYLDQTSPARIREQSHTNLPSDTYMAKANEESMTNANSPARAREGSPYQHVSVGQPAAMPVSTGYQPAPVPVSTGYQPAPVPVSTGYQHASPQQGYVSNGYASSTVAGSPGRADLGSVVPPGPGVPGEGESPRRLRAFGAPHSDPNAPNQSPQRTY